MHAAAAPFPHLFAVVSESSHEISGLTARLEKLCTITGGPACRRTKPHAFVYFITIQNGSDHTVTLLGRKWVIVHADGSRLVIEGDKIVGETPASGRANNFSYNSYTSAAVTLLPTAVSTASMNWAGKSTSCCLPSI